ncbi:MAG: hypothetical protein WC253_06900 [Sulfurovaceae bacterium]|nr:hypothetical protein [Sulfurovaceae bacterium]
MKRIYVLVLISIFFYGCRGGMIGLSGQDRVDFIAAIKPALYYWHKNGVSEEQKIRDWIECGGHTNGQFVWNETKIRQEMRPGEVYTTNIYQNKAYNRLQNKLINCMDKKGYKNLRD